MNRLVVAAPTPVELWTAMDELRDLLSKGYVITWVGSKEGRAWVRLTSETDDQMRLVTLDSGGDLYGNVVVRKNEGQPSTRKVGIVWECAPWYSVRRVASVMGLTMTSSASYGLTSSVGESSGIKFCTMAYDIETSSRGLPKGTLPPPWAQILCASVVCSCGYEAGWYTESPCSDPRFIYCHDTTALVEGMILAIQSHRPVWLIGHNCFQYDNTCMGYHVPKYLESTMIPIRSSMMGESSYAYYLDIPGVNNVDTYAYMDRVYRGKFPSLSLGMLAMHLGVGSKDVMTAVGSAYIDMDSLVSYNINDCVVTLAVWDKLQLASEITTICSVMKTPVIDACRYITGTMAASMISSYIISSGRLLEWSYAAPIADKFEGGLVLKPERGLYRNLVIVDYASMYPSLMIDCNISFENIYVTKSAINTGQSSVSWTDDVLQFHVNDTIVTTQRGGDFIIPAVLRRLLAWRKTVDKKSTFSTTIKVATNSIFGALGYENSPMNSPYGSLITTLAGRWCLTVSISIFAKCGLKVVYGDTDSCFLAAGATTQSHYGGDIQAHVNAALRIMHIVLSYTPFKSMRMEIETTLKAALLIKKKHYAMMSADGVLKTKGLSVVRKDRIGICKYLLQEVLATVLLVESKEEALKEVGRLLLDVLQRARDGELNIKDVSCVVRSEGNMCYKYRDMQGIRIVTMDNVDTSAVIPYDRAHILTLVMRELANVLVPSGLGTIEDAVRWGDEL